MAANTVATHSVSPEVGSIIESDPMFSSLCSLASFVTNSEAVITIPEKLTSDEVSVLSLLIATSQAEYLSIWDDLPLGTATQLASAISTSTTLCKLSLGRSMAIRYSAPEVFRMLTAAAANSAKLEQLSIYYLSINDWHESSSLERFSALSSLTIRADGTRSQAIPPLIASIGKLRVLESLSLQRILFTNLGVERLTETLKTLPLLSELSIRHAMFTAARPIGNLVAMGKIRKLDLKGNRIDAKEITAMVDAILACRRKTILEKLNLSYNGFGLEGERKVAELAACSPRLRVLNVKANYIYETFLNAAAAQSLEKLNVYGCALRPRAVNSILDTPHAFPALRALKMYNDNLDDLSARSISRFILASGWRTLRNLDMNWSHITEAGALELAPAFSKAYLIQTIGISGSLIGPRGAAAILDALAAASTAPMDRIDFERCQIGDAGAEAVGRLIARRGCRLVGLEDSQIHAPGAKGIADSLAISAFVCNMETMVLDNNPIGDEGVRYLMDALVTAQQAKQSKQRIRGALELRMETIEFGVEGAMAVKRMMETPPHGADAHHVLKFLCLTNPHDHDAEAEKILREVAAGIYNTKSAGIDRLSLM